MYIQLQETQVTPIRMNPERFTLRYITIKPSKGRERILKAARQNTLSHIRKPRKIIS